MVQTKFALQTFIATVAKCVFAAALLSSLNCFGQASALQEAGSVSVEEVRSMLDAIDPYRPDGDATGTISIFGSTSMDALAHSWAKGFMQFHRNVKVEISAAGSEAAFERLLKTPTGVAMLSRPVTDAELEALKKKGLKNPVAFVAAREALGVFVNRNNPVETISGEQLRTIFATDVDSKALTWSLLGASGKQATQPINIIARTPQSGTQKFLKDFVFRSLDLREAVAEFESNAAVVSEIAKNPDSIGICGLKCGASSAKALQLSVGASVVHSDDHAVLSGQYPLTRPLSLVIDIGQVGPAAKASQEYVRYALCQAGQSQTVLAGFYPVDLPLLRAGMQKLGTQQFR
jgi:phosphate transport system substrate-binding protein